MVVAVIPLERARQRHTLLISGPFPDGSHIAGQVTTIEQIINGVVTFRGVPGMPHESDAGVWDNAARVVPLYP